MTGYNTPRSCFFVAVLLAAISMGLGTGCRSQEKESEQAQKSKQQSVQLKDLPADEKYLRLLDSMLKAMPEKCEESQAQKPTVKDALIPDLEYYLLGRDSIREYISDRKMMEGRKLTSHEQCLLRGKWMCPPKGGKEAICRL